MVAKKVAIALVGAFFAIMTIGMIVTAVHNVTHPAPECKLTDAMSYWNAYHHNDVHNQHMIYCNHGKLDYTKHGQIVIARGAQAAGNPNSPTQYPNGANNVPNGAGN